jgi:hypothetical protein
MKSFGRTHQTGLSLMLASLLLRKEQWQKIANSLPKDGILIFLPAPENPLRKTIEEISATFEVNGYHVTTVTAERFR